MKTSQLDLRLFCRQHAKLFGQGHIYTVALVTIFHYYLRYHNLLVPFIRHAFKHVKNRFGMPEKSSNQTFEVVFLNLQTNFAYLGIYSDGQKSLNVTFLESKQKASFILENEMSLFLKLIMIDSLIDQLIF